MCNCFEETLSQIENKVSEDLKSTPMVEGSLRTDWENRVLFFSDKPAAPVVLYVNTKYRPLKKDNTPAKNVKRKQTGVVMS